MATFQYYRRNLPHYRVFGATYFVTWRVQSSAAPMSPAERTIVLEALRHFDGTRYDLLAHVVMDDHVHVVVRPRGGHALEKLLHSWKSYSARQINLARARTGPFWQAEYLDRIVRDDADLKQKIAYIMNNPRKRWPDLAEYAWVGCSRRVGDAGIDDGPKARVD